MLRSRSKLEAKSRTRLLAMSAAKVTRQDTILNYFENQGDPRYSRCEMVLAVKDANIDPRNTRQGRRPFMAVVSLGVTSATLVLWFAASRVMSLGSVTAPLLRSDLGRTPSPFFTFLLEILSVGCKCTSCDSARVRVGPDSVPRIMMAINGTIKSLTLF